MAVNCTWARWNMFSLVISKDLDWFGWQQQNNVALQ